MRRYVFTLAASAAVPLLAPAQAAMPGQQVGSSSMAKPIVQPVGTRLPAAAPQAGTPITGLATQTPGTVGPGNKSMNQQPPGTPLDLKNVVAPYPNMPKESSFWDKLEQRWFQLFESDAPAVRPNYTPGIARRNRDRRDKAEEMRRRDQ